mmetsp:Transcript_9517/g.18978  ORF Transcript_9517/g.18978 Transcript_9517/m.18978 type:complete len:143 (-) Transcript_9517:286-714(-)
MWGNLGRRVASSRFAAAFLRRTRKGPSRLTERPPKKRSKALHVGEIYGFVGAITTTVFAALYFAWAYTPDAVLHALGIYYYPSKYWALALPVWLSGTAVAIFWLYEGMNLALSEPLHSLRSLQDGDPGDMPLTQVNAMLFDR